eukprot:755025-Prymnesium_polylepis.1
MCSDSHRATIRREKRAQKAHGEGRRARQTSNRHPIGPGVVRSITPTRVVWPGRRRARPSGRARGYTLNTVCLGGKQQRKGVNPQLNPYNIAYWGRVRRRTLI